ncbi:TLD-domain-containing protein [Gorgonomyces haynaldii]|nr:TLD-domain-containing protein [Gorgonomyces haynaldii]
MGHTRTSSVSPEHYQPLKSVMLKGRHEETLAVLDAGLVELLRPCLSPIYKEALDWHLVYATDQHGTSIQTLFENASTLQGPFLLCIKDDCDNVFGGYLSERPCAQTNYYGNGSCFLWKKNGNKISLFLATGENEYYILSRGGEFLAMGGGNGAFGIYIDQELRTVTTEPCATYGNITLSDRKRTDILSLELWHLSL